MKTMKKTYIPPRITEEVGCDIMLLISASGDGWNISDGGISEGGNSADARGGDFFQDEDGEGF
jgi:hypothetical protein